MSKTNTTFQFEDHIAGLRKMLQATKAAILEHQLSNLGYSRDSLEEIELAVRDYVAQLETLDKGFHLAEWLEDNVGPLVSEHGISEVSDASNRKSKAGLREILIQVTQGMINQSLLTLTKPKKLGLISYAERFRITLPWGQEFTAEIKQPGNRLSERGLISEFYKTERINEGDYIQLSEIEEGNWQLSKCTYTPMDQLLDHVLNRKGK